MKFIKLNALFICLLASSTTDAMKRSNPFDDENEKSPKQQKTNAHQESHQQENIKLRWMGSEEDEYLEISRAAARHSATIANMIDDLEITPDQIIPLCNITKETLENIVACLGLINAGEFDALAHFIDQLEPEALFNLISAVNFLDIQSSEIKISHNVQNVGKKMSPLNLCIVRWAEINANPDVAKAYETDQQNNPVVIGNKNLPNEISIPCVQKLSLFEDVSFFNDVFYWLCNTITIPQETLDEYNYATLSVCCSPDQRYIVSGLLNGTLRILNTTTNEVRILTHGDRLSPVETVCWSPNGRYLVSGGGQTIKFWDAHDNFSLESTSPPLPFSCSSSCFSHDNQTLFCGGDSGDIVIFDGTHNPIKNIRGHNRRVTSLYCTTDNKYIFSIGKDKTLKLWNILFNKHLGTSSISSEGVVYISDDIQYMLYEFPNKNVKIIDQSPHSNRHATSFEMSPMLNMLKNDRRVIAVCCSPDGKHVFTSDNSWLLRTRIKRWDLSGLLDVKNICKNINIEQLHLLNIIKKEYSQNGKKLDLTNENHILLQIYETLPDDLKNMVAPFVQLESTTKQTKPWPCQIL